jgi:hypothetical protein
VIQLRQTPGHPRTEPPVRVGAVEIPAFAGMTKVPDRRLGVPQCAGSEAMHRVTGSGRQDSDRRDGCAQVGSD